MTSTLVSIEQTCKQLSVSRWQVNELIRTGQLVSVKIGVRRLIPDSAIDEYIRGLLAEPSPERAEQDGAA